jgi:hypothetical protein
MERTEFRLRRWIWVLPAVWLVHGLEEWNQGAHYRAHWVNAEELTDTGIRAWLLAMGVLGFVWTFAATRVRNDRVAVGLVLFFFVTQGFANTLQHLYWIGLLGVWSPGTATALLLVMPGTVWATVRALRERLVRGWYVALLYAAAIPVMIVTVQMGNEMPPGGLPFYRFASDLFA